MALRLDPRVRRDRILDTAIAIISEEGYRGLTMRSLARRCDMSAPGLMHHYPDLPTLLMAVLNRRDQRDAEAVLQRAGSMDARTVLDHIVDRMAADPQGAQLFAVLEAEALDPSHPAHAYFRDRAERAANSMREYLHPHFEDPHAAGLRILAILDGLQLSWLRDPDSFDLRAHWAAIADTLLPHDGSTR